MADNPPASVLNSAPPDPAASIADSPLGIVPDQIENVGAAQLSSVYGSMVVTDNGTHLDVYLTSPDPAAEAKLSALAPPGTITFVHTAHTRAQLLAVHADVTRQVDALASQGIQIVSWFPGIDGDGLEHIGVVSLTATARSTLEHLFGAGNIAVDNVAPSDVPVATGRDSDSPPWNGGDNIASHKVGCTSGAGVIYGGLPYMLTAAHCFLPGWFVYNAFCCGQAGAFMGIEASRDVSNGGDDTALLAMPVSDLIWTGIIGHPIRAVDRGVATNPVGDIVCNEGAYSGEVCSIVRNNYVGCISLKGYTGLSGARRECNIVFASRKGSGIASEDGDSGASMARYEGGQLKVTGIVSAGSVDVPCQYNDSTCTKNVYYTAMDEILSNEYPGARLRTG